MTPEEKEINDLLAKDETTTPAPVTPEVTNQPAPQPAAQPAGPRPAPAKKTHNPKFWGEDEEEAEPEPTAPGPSSPAPAATPAVTKEAIAMGARTAVATINLTMVTLFRPLLNWRFTKVLTQKFGAKLKEAFDLVDGGYTPASTEDEVLAKRLKRFLKIRDEKIKELPFTEAEEKDLEFAFKNYFTAKQVTMSPEVLLYCSAISIVGRRAIDVFVWE